MFYIKNHREQNRCMQINIFLIYRNRYEDRNTNKQNKITDYIRNSILICLDRTTTEPSLVKKLYVN